MKKHLLLLPFAALAAHAQTAVENEAQAIAAVMHAIAEHQPTSQPVECLTFIAGEAHDAYYQIDVHEKHDSTCGGDPNTAPRLFSYRVGKSDGSLSTDAAQAGKEWDGEYHPVSKKTAEKTKK